MALLKKIFRLCSSSAAFKVWVLFAVSVLISYTSLYSPNYISVFTGSKAIIQRLEPVVTSDICSLGKCEKSYRISFNRNLVNFQKDKFFLGRVWNQYLIKCQGIQKYSFGSKEDGAGYRIEKNQFQILDSSYLEGCEGEFEVVAFYSAGQKKSGFITSFQGVTSSDYAFKLKRVSEFIGTEMQLIVLFLVLSVLVFSFLVQVISIDSNSKIRVYLTCIIAFGVVAETGVIDTWIPISGITTIGIFVAFVSYCLYTTVSIFYFIPKFTKFEKKVYLIILPFIFFALFFVQNNFIFVWRNYPLACGLIGMLFSLKKRGLRSFLISVLVFSTGFEFNGYANLPYSYCVPIFLSLLFFSESYRTFLSFLKVNRLLKMSNKGNTKNHGKFDKKFRNHAIIKVFQKQFGIGRITILNLADPETIQLQQYSHGSTRPYTGKIKELTPIFAHVVTTGNSLINVHSTSVLVSSLRRGENRQISSIGFFTVLPIFAGKETIGAISITDYDSDQFRSSLNYDTFIFCLDILKGLLVEHLLTAPKTQSLTKISNINESIAVYDFSACNTVELLIGSFGAILNNTFGWRVLSAALPTQDFLLKIINILSFNAEVETQMRQGKLYALEDNRQGPLALAVHEKKPVIIPNTKWLDGVVHPNTIKFFNAHSTRTAAFIPVLGADGTALGVYWIEGVKESEISFSDRELFNSFMNILSERIKLMKSNSKLEITQKSLAQFLPQHLVQDYLAGKTVKEEDYGFLMMLDLKGSTRLSHAIGNTVFHEQMEILKLALEMKLKEFSWCLQQFLWDSFEFTYTSEEIKKEKISILQWYEIIEPVFENWKNTLLVIHGNMCEVEDLSWRLCFSYGDISRGIVVEGATQKWTFTGNAIANVSKVEQAAKHLNGKLFCDETILKHSYDEWREIHTTSQSLKIFGLDEESAIRPVKKSA